MTQNEIADDLFTKPHRKQNIQMFLALSSLSNMCYPAINS